MTTHALHDHASDNKKCSLKDPAASEWIQFETCRVSIPTGISNKGFVSFFFFF